MLLVTTPIEATWGSDQDIMFLGEWCKLYERKQIWSKRSYDVFQYHWDDRDELRGDFINLQELNKKILYQLTQILNSLHNVNHSERYWEILLGYWVNIFTGVVFDRWRMVEKAAESAKISKCYKLDVDINDLSANDISDFINLASNDDHWNQAIYTILIEINTSIEVETISENLSSQILFEKKPTISYAKQILSSIVFNKFKYFSRKGDAVILNSYLPTIEELKLQLSLGQFPILRKFPELTVVKTQNAFRNWKIDKRKSSNKFHSAIAYLLPKLLPKIYLENYDQLVSTVNKLKLPKNPKFIFTSNAHFNNSVFSEYAAKKNMSGTKIVLGDHGGFGCNAFNASVSYQLSIANISLSWGWKDRNYPNMRPFGIFKTIGKSQRWDKKGLGLMIQVAMPRYSYDIRAMPIAGQMIGYFKDQYNFYASLPEEIRKKLLIRLYHADYGWSQKNRWQNNFNDVLIDNNKLKISKLLQKSRICICTYNATTYLETLSLNVPTIIFWNKNNWEIHQRAEKYFKELEEVGIFHSTPEKAALMVAEIWNDIPVWWNQQKIQNARINFCNNFAKEISNPISELAKILRGTENE